MPLEDDDHTPRHAYWRNLLGAQYTEELIREAHDMAAISRSKNIKWLAVRKNASKEVPHAYKSESRRSADTA
jgi:hypothetical protein